MASGWAPDGAVQDQIDDTITDGVMRARARMPTGEGETHCLECGDEIPEARRYRGAARSPDLHYLSVGARSPSGEQRVQPQGQQRQSAQVTLGAIPILVGYDPFS